MEIRRRELLAGSAAAMAAATLPRISVASVEIGDLRVDSISDGLMSLPAGNWYSDLPADGVEILARHGVGVTQIIDRPLNVTLLRDGERTVLFDVGSGSDFLPGTGLLGDALDALGVAPEDITDVVLSHAHPDHINGLLDDFDDPFFYDANHHVGRIEFDYWMDPDTVNKVRADRQGFAVGALRRFEAIGDRVTLFGDGEEILQGVQAFATYGHTPGHMGFVIGGRMVLLADAVTDHHLSFERPDWPAAMDEDGDLAVQSRRRVLDMAATDGLTVLGYHLPGDGIGHVQRSGEAFRFVQ